MKTLTLQEQILVQDCISRSMAYESPYKELNAPELMKLADHGIFVGPWTTVSKMKKIETFYFINNQTLGLQE